jgi:hypothetical protein
VLLLQQARRLLDGRGKVTSTVIVGNVDTPGLRTLRLDGDADALSNVLDDITKPAQWKARGRQAAVRMAYKRGEDGPQRSGRG